MERHVPVDVPGRDRHPATALRHTSFPTSTVTKPFSDGSSVTVGPLNNDAIGTTVFFSPRIVSTLTLTVTGVSPTTWIVDPTNSYLRLTIPDQNLNVTNVGTVTVKLRDANSTTQWTDAGGRRAALGGQLVTEYVDGSMAS